MKSWHPCSPGCVGWLIGEHGIERCDECRRFVDDEKAQDYVLGLLAMFGGPKAFERMARKRWKKSLT